MTEHLACGSVAAMFREGYSVREVAALLRISRQRVHQLIVSRRVPTVRPDHRTVLIPRRHLSRLLVRVDGRPRGAVAHPKEKNS